MARRDNPHIKLNAIAIERENRNNGIKNVIETKNFIRNVKIVSTWGGEN